MKPCSIPAPLLGVVALACWINVASSEVPDYPQHIADGVMVYEIHEHQVVIKSPFDFLKDGGNRQDRHDLAGWACKLYNRIAVGPLHGWGSKGLFEHETHQRGRYHLYACAIP